MKILRLNVAGQPIEWLTWQQAVCLFARNLVVWTLGDIVREVRGGFCRLTGKPSIMVVPSIIACGGEKLGRPRKNNRVNNAVLFARDYFTCVYCGLTHKSEHLTRDHLLPISRGGKDCWENVVTACRRCNQFKSNRTPDEASMSLLREPYRPNNAEFLTLINSKSISGDQKTFLRKQYSRATALHYE